MLFWVKVATLCMILIFALQNLRGRGMFNSACTGASSGLVKRYVQIEKEELPPSQRQKAQAMAIIFIHSLLPCSLIYGREPGCYDGWIVSKLREGYKCRARVECWRDATPLAPRRVTTLSNGGSTTRTPYHDCHTPLSASSQHHRW
jgi:hypothetical protein